MTKKEEHKLWKKLVEKADKEFSLFIRLRDKDKHCITCDWPIQHNCHWISRGWYSHRRDEDNCYGGCIWCNMYHQEEHKVLLTVHQIKRFWQERVDKQLLERHKIKPSIEYLNEIIEKYKEKSKQMTCLWSKQVLKKTKKSV